MHIVERCHINNKDERLSSRKTSLKASINPYGNDEDDSTSFIYKHVTSSSFQYKRYSFIHHYENESVMREDEGFVIKM